MEDAASHGHTIAIQPGDRVRPYLLSQKKTKKQRKRKRKRKRKKEERRGGKRKRKIHLS